MSLEREDLYAHLTLVFNSSAMFSKEMNYSRGDHFILFLNCRHENICFLLLSMGCSEYMSFKRNLYSCHKRIKKKTH